MDEQRRLGLPYRPFLYTLDQICDLLQLTQKELHTYLFLPDVQLGNSPRDRMVARNIAPADLKPEWRIEERELIRWMKFKHVSLLTR